LRDELEAVKFDHQDKLEKQARTNRDETGQLQQTIARMRDELEKSHE